MHWNYPYGTNSGLNTVGGSPNGNHQNDTRPKNELVANRQQNTAGLWNGGQVTIHTNTLTNPTAEWRSPIFDLRPDLPFLSQGVVEATPVYRSKTGDWGSLWVLIDGLNQNFGGGLGFAGLRVRYQEKASPIDPTLVRNANDPIDITSSFAVNTLLPSSEQQQGALLQFKPTNDVDPVRYWQVIIYFDWTFTFTSNVQLRAQSSYY